MTREELDSICRRYGGSIFRRSFSILKNEAAAEDATQEVLILVFEKGHQFRGEAQISSWIYRVTTNHCLNVIRSEKRRKEREKPERGAVWMSEGAPDPYQSYLGANFREAILSKLDKLDAQIFVYRYLDGLKQEDLAEVTGKSRRTIGKRLKRIESMVETLKAQRAAEAS